MSPPTPSSSSSSPPSWDGDDLTRFWTAIIAKHTKKLEVAGAKSDEIARINHIALEKGFRTTDENEEHNRKMSHLLLSIHRESLPQHEARKGRMKDHVRDVWNDRQIDFLVQLGKQSNSLVKPFAGADSLSAIADVGWAYDGEVLKSGCFDEISRDEAQKRGEKRREAISRKKESKGVYRTPDHCRADLPNARQCYDSFKKKFIGHVAAKHIRSIKVEDLECEPIQATHMTDSSPDPHIFVPPAVLMFGVMQGEA